MRFYPLHTVGGHPSFAQRTCRYHCSSSRMKRRRRFPPVPSTHNLQKEMHRQSLSPKQITPSITEKLASIMFQIEIIFDATNWMYCCVWVRKWWFHSWFKELPQVPQQSLRSSMCSTSTPISHDPSETSSFAYLWSTCLKMIIWLNPRYSVRTGNLPFKGKYILVYWYVSCQIFRNSV